MSEFNIMHNLGEVRDRISNACREHERNTSEITLLAVSKTKPLSMVESALQAGQVHFGENYLQDALEKIPHISPHKAVWHFIGAIQSNKTKAIAEHFDWVHTVASEKVARRLNTQRPEGLAPLNVLIQINIDEEANKSGLLPNEAVSVIRTLVSMDRIKLRGLMAIPAKVINGADRKENQIEDRQNAFCRLRQLLLSIQELLDLPQFDQLSMGMSADLELAVAEGSTILRIGTAIFGARS